MPSVAIPFPRISSPGERSQLGGGRLVNAILEKLESGEVVIKRAPGLTRRITSASGNVHCRGMVAANSETLIVVYDDSVETVTRSGDATTSVSLGALAGTDLVTLARNNAAIPDIVCVSPSAGAFTLTSGGAPASYPDGDVGAPNSVSFVDGYFFFTYGSGKVQASGINTTAINSLDYASAESSPDPLVRGVGFRGQLFLFGNSTIEAWQNTANPTGFPFTRSTVIPRGLAGLNAVAGYEDGFVGSLLWAGSDNIVYKLNGYDPFRISTHDVERDLQKLSDKSTLRAFVFMDSGHPFFVLKSPIWTWVYDLLTSTWQERRSYGRLNWRAECGFFQWGEWLVGDELAGYVYRPSSEAFSEDAYPLIFDVTSGKTKDFPARFSVPRVDFDFVSGVGSPSAVADPTVSISWSDDGGNIFSTPLVRPLGGEGHYGNRVSINRAGRCGPQGRAFRLVVSDAVFVGLVGGKMQTAEGAPF